MSDNIILIDVQATDNASSVISGVSNTLVASFKKVDEASSGVAASINAAIAPLSTSEAAQLRSAESLQLMASAQAEVTSKQAALSSAIQQYGANSEQATTALRDFNQAQNQLAVIAPQNTDSLKQQSASFQDLIISVSGVATATFSLYSMYTNLEHSTLAVQKAKIQDAAATNNAEKAQQAYNDTVAKYGPNSAEAIQKATDLGIATDRASLASERASMAEQNHTQAMISGALMVTPTLITMVASLGKIRDMLRDSTILESISEGVSSIVKTAALGPTALLTAAQWQLNAALDANPVGIIILAIAGLVAAFIAAYTYIKPFRDAVNEVGSAIMSALKPAIDVIYGALKWLWDNILVPLGKFLLDVFIKQIEAVGAAIKWVADGIGAIANWIGDSWAKITGTFTDSVQKSMNDQLQAVTIGMQAQKDVVNAKYDDMVSTTEDAYKKETQAALDSWNSRLTQEVTGWDKVIKTANEQSDSLVDKVTQGLKDQETAINQGYDTQLSDAKSAYGSQVDAINSFYDDVIAVTQDKLNQIKGARSSDLDNLELTYLKQKEVMEATLVSQGTNLTAEQKASVLQAIEKKYSDQRSQISDKYRIQELEAEKANNSNIEQANKDRADALAAAAASETAVEVGLLNSKNTQLANAEKEANAQIAQINRDRNATIKEIQADRDAIEKQHTADLTLLAKQRESELTAIAQQGALDRYNIQKAANDKLGISTPAYNPESNSNPGSVTTLPVGFVGPPSQNQQYAPNPKYDFNSSLSSLLSMYQGAKSPQQLADDVKLLVQTGGGGYGDAIKLADSLGSKKMWNASQISAFEKLIPHFAEGADVLAPTIALIGEAGPERVQPLSRFSEDRGSLKQTNTIYVNVNIGNISSEIDLDRAKKVVLNSVVDGVGRRS